MLSAFQQLPMLVHLLRPDSQHKVNVPKLLLMLKPNFSEAASNTLRYEKDVYQLFVRYVREVASGRRLCGERQLGVCNRCFRRAPSRIWHGSVNNILSFFCPQMSKVSHSKKEFQQLLQVLHVLPTAVLRPLKAFQEQPMKFSCLLKRSFKYDLAFSQPFFCKL